MPAFSRASLASLLAAACTAAVMLAPVSAQGKTYHIRQRPASADAVKRVPLSFYVAKGEPDACGVGCSEWIAVEGNFDTGSASRFRAFLKKQDGNLRVVFHSPGGEVSNAFAIGRILRARGMTASIGMTVPQACAGGDNEACRKAKSSGKPVQARLAVMRGQCSSACAWAILGAKVREVPPGALLGVHSHRQSISITVRAGAGVSDERIRAYARERLRAYAKTERANSDSRTRDYMREMGISPDLYTFATGIPHESIYFLTRDEIVRYGIDTRSFAESAWELVELPSQRAFLIKAMTESRAPAGRGFRSSILVLTCDNGAGPMLVYGRQMGAGDETATVNFVAGTRHLGLMRDGQVTKLGPTGHQISYLTRAVLMPPDFLDAVVQTGGFDLVDASAASGPRSGTRKFAAADLTRALAELNRSCSQRAAQPQPTAARQ